jgi:DNA adenine methylase
MIRYIGSKSNLNSWILETCTEQPLNWVEPFGGMFSIYFTLDLLRFPETRFIYNEINPYHLNLFQHLKDRSFRRFLKSEIIDNDLYLESFDTYQEDGYLGAISWLRILTGSKNIKNILEPNYGGSGSWWSLIESLDSKEEHFNRMEIENLNYDKCLEKWDHPETFFYLDPPYFGYEDYYTYHNFNLEDHKKLRDILINLKAKWTLSYYQFDGLDQWYRGYQIDTKKVNLGVEWRIKKSD